MADAQGPPGEQLAEQIEEAPAWAGGLGGQPPQYGGGGEGGAAAAAPVEPLGEHAAADVSARGGGPGGTEGAAGAKGEAEAEEAKEEKKEAMDVDGADEDEDDQEDESQAEDDEDEDDDDEGEEEDDEDEESDESYVPDPMADVEGKDSEAEGGRTAVAPGAIHRCVLGQQLELLAQLLETDPSVLLELDGLGRSPLHVALIRARPEVVKVLLAARDADVVERSVRAPFRGPGARDVLPALHLALSASALEHAAAAAQQCLELLLARPRADLCLGEVDSTGRAALHWACKLGRASAVDSLMHRRADPGLRDDLGNFALHYAIDSRSRPCVEAMLRASEPSLFSGQLHPFYRCIDRQAWEAAFLIYRRGWPIPQDDIGRLFDFAAARGLAAEWNFVSERGVEGTCALEELQWPAEVFSAGPTALVTHPICAEHGALPLDVEDLVYRQRIITRTPENPSRLEVLCGERGVLRGEAFRELRWVGEAAAAPLVDVLRVHEYRYVHKLMEKARETEAANAGNPFSKVALDGGDTKITRGSWAAALRACGCVLEAVDLVCNEQARNAFCAMRPPGHHLGPAGACNNSDLEDDDEGSQGFCLLNNVAVGAAYARCVYRHMAPRVAIVDIDVHHGNGTEAIVRHVRCRQRPATSSHVTVGGFAARVEVELPPSCKPWLEPEGDAESLFFASIHGYGSGFYPRTGKACNESSPKIVNVTMRPDSSSADFRDGMRSQILPELLAFAPDIIFVSAGFDAHEDDLVGNCRLVDEDYVWATQQLLAVANRCCKGRLVSVLEGGYNTRAEALSPFAQAVATHVRTLMHTSPNYSHLECAGPEAGDARRQELREADRDWVNGRAAARAARRKKRLAEEAAATEAAAEPEAPAGGGGAPEPPAKRQRAEAPQWPADASQEAQARALREDEMRLAFGMDEDEDDGAAAHAAPAEPPAGPAEAAHAGDAAAAELAAEAATEAAEAAEPAAEAAGEAPAEEAPAEEAPAEEAPAEEAPAEEAPAEEAPAEAAGAVEPAEADSGAADAEGEARPAMAEQPGEGEAALSARALAGITRSFSEEVPGLELSPAASPEYASAGADAAAAAEATEAATAEGVALEGASAEGFQ